MSKSAAMMLALLMICSWTGAQEVLFEDQFDGSSVDAGMWNVTDSAGGVSVSGGYLEGIGKWTWNDPDLNTSGIFAIPTDRQSVEVEWTVQMLEPGFIYLGVYGSIQRGFLLQGGDAGGLSANGIHLQTAAGNNYGFQVDFTDPYPLNSDFNLKMTFNLDGTMAYQADVGSGYFDLNLTGEKGGSTSGEPDDMLTWDPGANTDLYLVIQPNNYNATSGNLIFKLNSVVVTGSAQVDTMTPTPTPTGPTPTPTSTPTHDPGVGLGVQPSAYYARIEDDFNNAAGPMPNEGEGGSPITYVNFPAFGMEGLWASNGASNNTFDGSTSVLIPAQGGWTQYLDCRNLYWQMENVVVESSGGTYYLVAIFSMPGTGGGSAVGFGNNASWAAGDPTRVFKLSGGTIYFSNDTWSTGSDISVGSYVADTPQGLMMEIAPDGQTSLYYQDGSDKSIDSAAWVDITPGSSALLDFVFGPNLIGVNTYAGGSGDFQLDYIGLLSSQPVPSPTPEPDFTGMDAEIWSEMK